MPRPLNPDSGRYELKADPDHMRLWALAAESRGLELASWVRDTLTAAARRTLDRAAEQPKKRKR